MTTHVLILAATPAYQRLVRRALPEPEWRVTTDTATLAQCADSKPLVFYAAPEWSATPTQAATAWENLRRTCSPTTPIIVLGQTGEPPHAPCTALLHGATDYLPWPVTAAQVRARAEAWRDQLPATPSDAGFLTLTPYPAATTHEARPLIGSAPAMVALYRQLAHALGSRPSLGCAPPERPLTAQTNRLAAAVPTFFVTGETGTGKELVARLIHHHSPFARGPFVAVNCSALPAELAEAELFGCVAGAFTGATHARAGLWEMAAGGTLLLDEITEAPAGVLPKLLRVLEDGQVRRVGGRSWRTVSVQVIAASNRTLAAALAQGTLRADLYHRLSQHHLHLPPLRARREDIMLLTQHFIRSVARRAVVLERTAARVLEEYAWPGNVRQLKHVVGRVLNASPDGRLWAAAFGAQLAPSMAGGPTDEAHAKALDEATAGIPPPAEGAVSARTLKRQAAQTALAQCAGNVTRAAAALGVSRPTFYKLLR